MRYKPQIHHRRSIRLKGYDYSQPGVYFITICIAGRRCLMGCVSDGVMELSKYGRIAKKHWIELPNRFSGIELGEYVIMPNHMHGIVRIHDVGVPVGASLADARNADDFNNRARASRAPTDARNDVDNFDTGIKNVGASLADARDMANLNNRARASRAPTYTRNTANLNNRARACRAPTNLGDVVGAYKSLVANEILTIFKQNNEHMGKFWQRNYYERIIRDQESVRIISEYITNNPVNWEKDTYYKRH